MKDNRIRLVCYLVLALFASEIIARFFVLTGDIPDRMIDVDGIQKYVPNQEGEWQYGSHSWHINAMGWPGPLPESKSNLITIIGDSFIESFMNAGHCRQSTYLKNRLPEYNFMEASRSGVSLIEAFTISKQLNALKPNRQLLYVHDSNFSESILQHEKRPDVTQFDLESRSVIRGKLNTPLAKSILYNCKSLYFLYLTGRKAFFASMALLENDAGDAEPVANRLPDYRNLLRYIKDHYEITDKLLIFRPESHPAIIQLSKEMGFRTVWLKDTGDDTWLFEEDDHWNCYGHKKAAEQVTRILLRP